MPLRKKKNYLRELRTKKGYSGYDLQILTSIPAQEIYRIERGLRRPLPHQKALFAKALKLSEQEIFPDKLRWSREIIEG